MDTYQQASLCDTNAGMCRINATCDVGKTTHRGRNIKMSHFVASSGHFKLQMITSLLVTESTLFYLSGLDKRE